MNYTELIEELNRRKKEEIPFYDLLKQIEESEAVNDLLHKDVTLASDYFYFEEIKKAKYYSLKSIKTFINLISSYLLTKEESFYYVELIENSLIILNQIDESKFLEVLTSNICTYIQNFGKILLNYILNFIYQNNNSIYLFYALKIINYENIQDLERIFDLIYLLNDDSTKIIAEILFKITFTTDKEDYIFEYNNHKLKFFVYKPTMEALGYLKIQFFILGKIDVNIIYESCLETPDNLYSVYINACKANKLAKISRLLSLLVQNRSSLSTKLNEIISLIKINNIYYFFDTILDTSLVEQYLSFLFIKKEYLKIIEYYENKKIKQDKVFINILAFKCYMEINNLTKANELVKTITNNNDYSTVNYKIILYNKLGNHGLIMNIFNQINDKYLFIKLISTLYHINSPKLIEMISLFISKFSVNVYIVKMYISLIFISNLSVKEKAELIYKTIKPLNIRELSKKLKKFLYKVIYNTLIEIFNFKDSILYKLARLLYRLNKSQDSTFLILLCLRKKMFIDDKNKKIITKIYNNFIKKENNLTEVYFNINILFYELLRKEECYNNLLPLNKLTNDNIILLLEVESNLEEINKKISIILECKNRRLDYSLIIKKTTGVLNIIALFEKLSLYMDLKEYINYISKLKESLYDEYLINRINNLMS